VCRDTIALDFTDPSPVIAAGLPFCSLHATHSICSRLHFDISKWKRYVFAGSRRKKDSVFSDALDQGQRDWHGYSFQRSSWIETIFRMARRTRQRNATVRPE